MPYHLQRDVYYSDLHTPPHTCLAAHTGGTHNTTPAFNTLRAARPHPLPPNRPRDSLHASPPGTRTHLHAASCLPTTRTLPNRSFTLGRGGRTLAPTRGTGFGACGHLGHGAGPPFVELLHAYVVWTKRHHTLTRRAPRTRHAAAPSTDYSPSLPFYCPTCRMRRAVAALPP